VATEEQIKALAYTIWEHEGRPEGKDAEHYFRAKQMLEEQEAASSGTEANGPPVPTVQPPSAPKPVKRQTSKNRSLKKPN
jgi:hypothetical protein